MKSGECNLGEAEVSGLRGGADHQHQHGSHQDYTTTVRCSEYVQVLDDVSFKLFNLGRCQNTMSGGRGGANRFLAECHSHHKQMLQKCKR